MSDFRFFSTHRSWEDWFGMLLGVLIVISPWFPFSSHDVMDAERSTMILNTFVVGMLIFGLAQLEYVALQRWEEVGEIVLGLWLIASPFIFGYSGFERAAMVVGSVIDPDSLGNPHVRVHALEGKLFREVVAEALKKRGIDCGVLVERDVYAKAAPTLASTEPKLRAEIAALGHGRIKPWRAEEKLATLAALWSMVPGEKKRGKLSGAAFWEEP